MSFMLGCEKDENEIIYFPFFSPTTTNTAMQFWKSRQSWEMLKVYFTQFNFSISSTLTAFAITVCCLSFSGSLGDDDDNECFKTRKKNVLLENPYNNHQTTTHVRCIKPGKWGNFLPRRLPKIIKKYIFFTTTSSEVENFSATKANSLHIFFLSLKQGLNFPSAVVFYYNIQFLCLLISPVAPNNHSLMFF